MTNKKEILGQLFTDDSDVNANELFDLLSPFIKIIKENKGIIFLDAALKHNLKNKILLFILAKKALFLMEELETDRVRTIDIVRETGFPKGSVNPTLKKLKDIKGNSLVSSDSNGYYVTSYQIAKIKLKNIFKIYEKNKE